MYKWHLLKYFGTFTVFIDRTVIEFQKHQLINRGNTNPSRGFLNENCLKSNLNICLLEANHPEAWPCEFPCKPPKAPGNSLQGSVLSFYLPLQSVSAPCTMQADSCPFWFNYFPHAHARIYLSHPLTILYPRPLERVSLCLLLHSQCPRVSSPVHYILSPSLNTLRGSLALFQSFHICITLPPLPLLIVITVFVGTHTNTHHFQTLTLISGQGHVLLTCARPKRLKWVIRT
jgi:hypothetical protein